MGERVVCNHEVAGSIPVVSTKQRKDLRQIGLMRNAVLIQN